MPHFEDGPPLERPGRKKKQLKDAPPLLPEYIVRDAGRTNALRRFEAEGIDSDEQIQSVDVNFPETESLPKTQPHPMEHESDDMLSTLKKPQEPDELSDQDGSLDAFQSYRTPPKRTYVPPKDTSPYTERSIPAPPSVIDPMSSRVPRESGQFPRGTFSDKPEVIEVESSTRRGTSKRNAYDYGDQPDFVLKGTVEVPGKWDLPPYAPSINEKDEEDRAVAEGILEAINMLKEEVEPETKKIPKKKGKKGRRAA